MGGANLGLTPSSPPGLCSVTDADILTFCPFLPPGEVMTDRPAVLSVTRACTPPSPHREVLDHWFSELVVAGAERKKKQMEISVERCAYCVHSNVKVGKYQKPVKHQTFAAGSPG